MFWQRCVSGNAAAPSPSLLLLSFSWAASRSLITSSVSSEKSSGCAANMATRRLTASTVEWAEFAKKVPDAQRTAFNAIKLKQDMYARVINSLPDKLPAIDWNVYRARVTVPGMAEDFQKRYTSLEVPYPKDTLSSAIEQQAKDMKLAYEQTVAQSKKNILEIQSELAKWEAMMPVEEMNLEEAMEAAPELVVNANKPSFWPHNFDMEDWWKRVEHGKKMESAGHVDH